MGKLLHAVLVGGVLLMLATPAWAAPKKPPYCGSLVNGVKAKGYACKSKNPFVLTTWKNALTGDSITSLGEW